MCFASACTNPNNILQHVAKGGESTSGTCAVQVVVPIATTKSNITTKSLLPERAEMRVAAALSDGRCTNARLENCTALTRSAAS